MKEFFRGKGDSNRRFSRRVYIGAAMGIAGVGPIIEGIQDNDPGRATFGVMLSLAGGSLAGGNYLIRPISRRLGRKQKEMRSGRHDRPTTTVPPQIDSTIDADFHDTTPAGAGATGRGAGAHGAAHFGTPDFDDDDRDVSDVRDIADAQDLLAELIDSAPSGVREDLMALAPTLGIDLDPDNVDYDIDSPAEFAQALETLETQAEFGMLPGSLDEKIDEIQEDMNIGDVNEPDEDSDADNDFDSGDDGDYGDNDGNGGDGE